VKRNVRYNRQLNIPTDQPSVGSQKKKAKLPLKKIIRPAIIVLAIALLAYAIIASSLLRIQTIKVEGARTLSADSVRQQTQDVLTSSPLTQNILFVPTGKISDELKKQNYQIAEADVSRSGFNSITVKITEQKPSILWLSGNTLSIIGANGHAYDGEITDVMKQRLVTVVDTTNLPVKKGEKVVTQEFVDFVNTMHTGLPGKGITVKQYQIGDSTTELRATTEAGYYILFDTTRPAEEQLQDLSAVLAQMKKQNKKATEYIDLRINGKVFYK
jgi:cell division septal protein FtsQ